MSDTHDPDERLGRALDGLLGEGDIDPSDLDVPADDLEKARAVAAAFDALLAPDAEQVDAVLDAFDDAAVLPPPELPDDYELNEEIGRGGMGVVYRARQLSLDRTVAVKVLRPGELMLGNAIRRFTKEARALAKLRHRHIVSVHEVGHVRGQVYYTMDLIEGTDLRRLLKSGSLTPAHAVRLLRQVAGAIAYTHAHGLIHRDLKPANILVDAEGDACVTDFGLALEIGATDGLTLTGQVLGTPAYMSPEQARGDTTKIGEPTDVYALGAVLYECLTGRVPFEATSPAEQIYAVLHGNVPRPRKLRSDIPRDLEVICLKALERDPSQRYPTARAFLEDLEQWESGRPIRAQPTTTPRRLGRWARRNGAVLGSSVATAALLILAALWWVPGWRNDPAQMLAMADEFSDAGQLTAAERLYSNCLPSDPEAALPSSSFLEKLLRARVAVIWEHAANRDFEAADRVLSATRQLVTARAPMRRDLSGRLQWESLILQGLQNPSQRDFQQLRDTLAELARPIPDLGIHSFRFEQKMAEIVADLPTDLRSPHDSRRPVVVEQLTAIFHLHRQAEGTISEWVYGQPEQRGERLLAALEAAHFDERTAVGTNGLRDTLLRTVDRDDTIAFSLRACEDERRSPIARAIAATVLRDLADLPIGLFRQADHSVLLRPTFSSALVADAWRQVQALPPEAAHRKRVEIGVAAFVTAGDWIFSAQHREPRAVPPASLRSEVYDWLAAHTGVRFRRRQTNAGGVTPDSWWNQNQDRSAVDWLIDALELDQAPTERDFDALIDRMRQEPNNALPLHHLLRLTMPSGTHVPTVLASDAHAPWLWQRWKSQRAPDARKYRLRVARIALEGGTTRLLDDGHERLDLPRDQQVSTKLTHLEAPQWTLYVRALPLGWARPPAPSTIQTLETTVSLKDHARALVLDCGRTNRSRRGPEASWSSGSSHGGRGAIAGHVRVARHQEMKSDESGLSDPWARVATLFHAESADSASTTWTLPDWRAEVARNAAELAETTATAGAHSKPFQGPHYNDVVNVAAAARALRVPDALEDLQRLSTWYTQKDRHFRAEYGEGELLMARLHAGDESALNNTLRILIQPQNRGSWLDYPDTRELARLYLSTDSGSIRDWARSRLLEAEFDAELAADLRHAPDSFDLDPELRGRLNQHDAKAMPAGFSLTKLWPGLLAVGLFWIAALAYAIGSWVQLRRGTGPRAAAVALLILGLISYAVRVDLHGMDLLPGWLGLACAALGCWLYSRVVPSRAAGVTTVCWVLGSLLAGLVSMLPIALLAQIVETLVAIGMVTLVVFSHAVDRSTVNAMQRVPQRKWASIVGGSLPSSLVVALFLGALLLMALFGVLFGSFVMISTASIVVFAVSVLLFVMVRAAPNPQRPRNRRIPLLFLIGFVLPTLGARVVWLGIGVAHWITGEEYGGTVSGDVVNWALFITTACVVWELARLLRGALCHGVATRIAADLAVARSAPVE